GGRGCGRSRSASGLLLTSDGGVGPEQGLLQAQQRLPLLVAFGQAVVEFVRGVGQQGAHGLVLADAFRGGRVVGEPVGDVVGGHETARGQVTGRWNASVHVAGPIRPSWSRPWACWNASTRSSYSGPNRPSLPYRRR